MDSLLSAEEAQKITQQFQKEFPAEALKQRSGGGGRSFTYVEGHAAIHRVLDVTGGAYTMDYITHWIDVEKVPSKVVGEAAKERRILNLLISVDIPGLGPKLGLGVAVLGGGEDLAKGAITDAFKNAMKYNGQALGLYGDDYEAPVEVPPKKRLGQLLKMRGGTSIAALDKLSQEHYTKDIKALTEEEILTWIKQLEEEGVPF